MLGRQSITRLLPVPLDSDSGLDGGTWDCIFMVSEHGLHPHPSGLGIGTPGSGDGMHSPGHIQNDHKRSLTILATTADYKSIRLLHPLVFEGEEGSVPNGQGEMQQFPGWISAVREAIFIFLSAWGQEHYGGDELGLITLQISVLSIRHSPQGRKMGVPLCHT